MNTGALRNRITFLSPTVTRNTYNEDIQVWTPFYTCWASIQPLRGTISNLQTANTVGVTATHQIIIRFNSQINETMRIQYGAVQADDFQTFVESELDALTDGGYAELQSLPGIPQTTYTITSILDTDSLHRQQVILATSLKY